MGRGTLNICSTSLGYLAVPLKCLVLFFAESLLKKLFEKAIPHPKNSHGTASQSELNKGIWREELHIWRCSSFGQLPESIPAISNLCILSTVSWKQEGDRYHCRLAFLLPGDHAMWLLLTAWRRHHPWSHYGLASSRDKLRRSQEECSTQN